MAYRRTTVPITLVATVLATRWQTELSAPQGWYSVTELANWTDISADAVETAVRQDPRFQVRAAAEMPEDYARTERKAGGFWPYVRMLEPEELAAHHAAIAAQDEAALQVNLALAGAFPGPAPEVRYDAARRSFVVTGWTPEGVLAAVREREGEGLEVETVSLPAAG